MKQGIRHRRLHAFFRSKVLNSLMVVVVVCLFMMNDSQTMELSVACGSLAMLFFIGYSLWFWIKKPKSIVINEWLSNINSAYILYFLIVRAMTGPNRWWYITPVLFAVILLFVALINKEDKNFEIRG